jgi:hypothetical protein
VLGATGSGKTSLLRSFVNRNRGEEYEPTTKVLSVVNSVEMEGVEKYLVVSLPLLIVEHQLTSQLQEFGSKYESETLRNSKKLDMADIIIYVHDSSDTNSFSYISNLRVSTSPYHLSYADMTATILLRPYPICLCRYEIRSRSRTTTPRSSARYILSSPSLTGANSSLDTRRISHESLGRRHKNGPQPVSPY